MQPDISDAALDSYVNLIDYASRLYAKRFRSPFLDEKDFYGEGVIRLLLCWRKWNGDPQDFGKYFKASLFNRFNEIIRQWKQKEIKSCSYDGIAISSNDGFHEVAFRELCEYVASGLEQPDRTIFVLLTDPPQKLCRIALLDFKKRERKTLFVKNRKSLSEDSHYRLNAKHVVTYLNNRGLPLTLGQYRFALKRIRKRVEKVIQESRPSLTV